MAKGFNIRAWLGLDTKSFDKGIKKSRQNLTGFQKGLRGINDTLRGLQFAAIGVTAVGAFSRAITVMKGFETSMARVKVLSGATDDQLVQMEATVRDIGATTKFSAIEGAEGLQFLAMAGLEVDESLAALPSTMNLAGAAMIGVGRSADIVTNVLSGFSLGAHEASRVADVFAQASRSANTTVDELYEGIKLIAPAYNNLGLSVEEAARDMSLLANSGIKAEQAGTALAGAMSRLLRQPPLVSKALKQLGVTVTESKLKQEGLIGVIRELRDVGIDATQMTKILGLHWKTAGALISLTDDKIESLTDKINDNTGASKYMSEEGIGAIDKSIKLLISAVDELILSFGQDEGLAKHISVLIDFMRSLVMGFTKLSGAGQALQIAILGLAIKTKMFSTNLVFAVKNIRLLPITLRLATASTKSFGMAMKSASGLIGIALIAVEALVIAFANYESAATKAAKAEQKLRDAKKSAKETTTEELIKKENELLVIRGEQERALDDQKRLLKGLLEIEGGAAPATVKARKSSIESISKEIENTEKHIQIVRKEFRDREIAEMKRESDAAKQVAYDKLISEMKAEDAAQKIAEENAKRIQAAISLRTDEIKTIKQAKAALAVLGEAQETASGRKLEEINARINILKNLVKSLESAGKTTSITPKTTATDSMSALSPADGLNEKALQGVIDGKQKLIDLTRQQTEEQLKLLDAQERLTYVNGGVWKDYRNDINEAMNTGSLFEQSLISLSQELSALAVGFEGDAKDLGYAMEEITKKTIKMFISEGVAAVVAKALATTPFPLSLVAAPAAGAAASALFSAAIPGFNTGGIADGNVVGGSSFAGDKKLIRVNSGEMILSKGQQSNLHNMIKTGGGAGQVEFVIKGDTLVGALNNNKAKRGSFS